MKNTLKKYCQGIIVTSSSVYAWNSNPGVMPSQANTHGIKCVSETTRPFSDFLDAQGTLHVPPQFFPPVQDYVGWAE